MKIKTTSKLIAFTLAIMVLFASCVSTTMINSKPQGAKVIIDSQIKGTTPYSHSDSKAAGGKTPIILELEGYDNYVTILKRDELNGGRLVLGLLLFWPALIWAADHPDMYYFELNKTDGNITVPYAPGIIPEKK